ncbi:MAG: hypothetical protein N3A38_07955, partial [Planctomycetota bacterium]|nr:hypothetical protein [Planctomycetota bacterium]
GDRIAGAAAAGEGNVGGRNLGAGGDGPGLADEKCAAGRNAAGKSLSKDSCDGQDFRSEPPDPAGGFWRDSKGTGGWPPPPAERAAESNAGPILVPVRDAKRDDVYAAAFRGWAYPPGRIWDDAVMDIRTLAERLSPGTVLFGDAPVVRRKFAAAGLSDAGAVWLDWPSEASPRRTALLGYRALAAGEAVSTAEKIHAFAPRYLKLSHPEIKLRAQVRGEENPAAPG